MANEGIKTQQNMCKKQKESAWCKGFDLELVFSVFKEESV
jgi:hypothetical protein